MNHDACKPHAVCIPFPAQGHINPMLKLAKLLHHKGFHITFLNTEYNHKRLIKSRGPNSVNGLPDFRFETIPDGLPPSEDLEHADATQHIPSLCDSISKNNCLGPFRDLLYRLINDSNVPPVSCVVSDTAMQFTNIAAREFGIPDIGFVTSSPCSTLCFSQLPRLVRKGLTPVTDGRGITKEYLDTVIDWIPGIKSIRFRDLPSIVRTTDPNDFMLNYFLNKSYKVSAIAFNTFDSLEQDVLDALSAILPPIYTVGPLHLLVNQIKNDHEMQTIATNLWTEQVECVKWLDSKEPNSVLYVNFGSVAVMTHDQLIEIAWGLANSQMQFLWIIRPDLVIGKATSLPPKFVSETKDRGMLASWCAQEEVLKHPSIGGFLSHMGWNSTIESIGAGVPMLCLPFVVDQQTNCRFACTEWGIGMEIDNDVKRDQVEMLVRELMEGEKGVEMKVKAMEWKEKAEEASRPGGSSFRNLEKLFTNIILSDKHSTV